MVQVCAKCAGLESRAVSSRPPRQWTRSVRAEGERLTLSVSLSFGAVVPEIVRYLVASGVDVYEVTPQRLSLEERFLEIVGTDGVL